MLILLYAFLLALFLTTIFLHNDYARTQRFPPFKDTRYFWALLYLSANKRWRWGAALIFFVHQLMVLTHDVMSIEVIEIKDKVIKLIFFIILWSIKSKTYLWIFLNPHCFQELFPFDLFFPIVDRLLLLLERKRVFFCCFKIIRIFFLKFASNNSTPTQINHILLSFRNFFDEINLTAILLLTLWLLLRFLLWKPFVLFLAF